MKKKQETNFFEKYNMKWVLIISVWTFLLAIVISIIAESSVQNLNIIISFIVLLFIIILGIVFDTIGIAVTRAEEKSFHSMAARKIDEARLAIKLVRNSPMVSNICNDVVGDISGIISGAVGSGIIFKLINTYDIRSSTILTILFTSLIASLTVGGKALGKSIAQIYDESIVYQIAKILNFIEKKFGLKFFQNDKKNKNRNKK